MRDDIVARAGSRDTALQISLHHDTHARSVVQVRAARALVSSLACHAGPRLPPSTAGASWIPHTMEQPCCVGVHAWSRGGANAEAHADR
jgi:hypothetical protein